MIDAIIALYKRNQENFQADPGDFIGEDGLLHCGKCKGAKQCEVPLGSGTIKPYILCPCKQAIKDEEERKWKEQQFRDRVDYLRKTCFPDAAMAEFTFENADNSNEKLQTVLKRYVEQFDEMKKNGQGLMLYGSVGTGKTYAACEIANALIDRGIPCHATTFSRVLNQLQATYDKQEYLDDLCHYDLLILDDLFAERDTEYARDQVLNVVDARYRKGLPLIITTNVTLEYIQHPQTEKEERIMDRLRERCFPVEVNGVSRRKTNFAANYKDLKKKLGLEG